MKVSHLKTLANVIISLLPFYSHIDILSLITQTLIAPSNQAGSMLLYLINCTLEQV